MPVDLEPVAGGNLRVTLRGSQPPLAQVVPASERAGQKLHVTHLATCKAKPQRDAPVKPPRATQSAEQGELFGTDAR